MPIYFFCFCPAFHRMSEVRNPSQEFEFPRTLHAYADNPHPKGMHESDECNPILISLYLGRLTRSQSQQPPQKPHQEAGGAPGIIVWRRCNGSCELVIIGVLHVDKPTGELYVAAVIFSVPSVLPLAHCRHSVSSVGRPPDNRLLRGATIYPLQ